MVALVDHAPRGWQLRIGSLGFRTYNDPDRPAIRERRVFFMPVGIGRCRRDTSDTDPILATGRR